MLRAGIELSVVGCQGCDSAIHLIAKAGVDLLQPRAAIVLPDLSALHVLRAGIEATIEGREGTDANIVAAHIGLAGAESGWARQAPLP